jgi:hypothetical protein
MKRDDIRILKRIQSDAAHLLSRVEDQPTKPTRPDVEPDEPDEPTREPEDEPRTEPTGEAPKVSVVWDDNDDALRNYVTASAVEVMPGVWIMKSHRSCNAPVIVTESHGIISVIVANCFPDTGTVTIKDLEITWPDGSIGVVDDFVLLPGQGRNFAEDRPKIDDPGTAHPAALAEVEEWAADTHGFDAVEGAELFGGKQANVGGAAGIYPHLEKVFGSSLGIFMCHLAGVAASNRHRMWRFSREAWAEGKLEPHKFEAPFYGFDKTRAADLTGYGSQREKIHGHDQYNSNHISRLAGWIDFAAQHGLAFDRLAMRVLADEVRLGWCERSDKARRLSDQGNPAAYNWFGCYEILEQYPYHNGCHLIGRGAGHDWLTLVRAERLFPGRYTEDLRLIAKTIGHVFDHAQGAVLAIPALDPIWNKPVDAYSKKISIDNEVIPPGEFPRIQRSFEEVLVWYAVNQLAEVLSDSNLLTIANKMRSALHSFNGGSSQLRVLANSGWNDPAQALATRNMLGIPGDPWNKGKSFEELLASKPGIHADNPVFSMHPSLVEGEEAL